jgi:hypothetical protein
MRSSRIIIYVAVFLSLFVGLILLAGEGDDSQVQAQLGKPAMWGDDVLVHQGYISRYSRNGYSVDYDDDYGVIFAAVMGYSSGPDTCFIYLSVNGGEDWIPGGSFDTTTDFSNPQVVIGEGTNPYQFYFLLDHHAGEIILKRVYQTTVNTYRMSNDVESFSATRDDPGDNYYLHLAQAKNNGEIIFSYSTNFGANWQSVNTVDGDMPHVATSGPLGEAVYLTWRLDGEDGAFYGAAENEKIAKNLTPGTGGWKYYTLPLGTSYAVYRCLLQGSDGTIYAGADTCPPTGCSGNDRRCVVFKSQDGGQTWAMTDDLGDQTNVNELLQAGDGTIYAATSGEDHAKVFKTTNKGDTWINTGAVGTSGYHESAPCIAQANDAYNTLYVGTGEYGDVFKSTDGGDNWVECAELNGAYKIYDVIVTYSGAIIAGGEPVDPLDSLGYFRSTNGGDSWNYIEPVMGLPRGVNCLFQASDSIIYAGVTNQSFNAQVMKSTDDGVSWIWTSLTASGWFYCFLEGPYSYIYTSNGYHVYRSVDQGFIWTQWSGSPGLYDMIWSKHQIAVKRSTSRGVTWQDTEKLSANLCEKSDPKVAGTYVYLPGAAWVAYSEKTSLDDWHLKYAWYSGTSWSKDHTLRGVDGHDQQLCDLRCPRGTYSTVHAVFCSDETGSRKLYYQSASSDDPDNWSDTLCITGKRPTLAHTPEICFYQGDPLVFFSWGFGFPYENPQHLYVNAQQWTGVEEPGDGLSPVPEFSLSQNFPNPFNPVTIIRYTVHRSPFTVHSLPRTTMKIYNIKGQLVRTLVDEPKEAGNYQVIWDGKTDDGQDAASGVYFYELNVGDYSQTKKMIFLK